LADVLAVGPATRAWREPAHDFAHVPGRAGAGRADCLVDKAPQLLLAECLREVLLEDRDLRLLLRGEVLAGALAECLDGLAARLDLAAQHLEELVVRQRLALPLLEVVGGTRRHSEDIAAQRVTRPHGGGQLRLDPLLEGHRGWLLGWALGLRAARGAG